jgi:hypothetical protein
LGEGERKGNGEHNEEERILVHTVISCEMALPRIRHPNLALGSLECKVNGEAAPARAATGTATATTA